MKKIAYVLLLGVAVFCLYFSVVDREVFAIDTTEEQGIQISPTRVELNALPGNSYAVKLKVTNTTPLELFYSTTVNDFGAADEIGTPRVLLDNDLPETSSIVTWVADIGGFTVPARETKELLVTVDVPLNAEPGGHYGVIRFSGDSPELEGDAVGLSASAGVLFLIRVDGDITEEAELVSFYSASDTQKQWFFETSPVYFVTRVQNNGNVHIKPNGVIEVRDMFGGLVSNMSVNADLANALPDSIRRFDAKLEHPWMVGKYTASLTMAYGSNGQVIMGQATFWVIPYRLFLAVFVVLTITIYVIIRISKAYNRRMVERVRREVESAIEKRKTDYQNENQQNQQAQQSIPSNAEVEPVKKSIEVKKDD
jgi:Na+-transporting methylmalonyl-CoA/oxaloacetate decarboxylase gamma subunit